MQKLFTQLFVCCVVLFSAPLAAQNSKDAYLDIKKSAFKKQYKQLAVMPIAVTPALGMPESMKQPIMDEVLKKFSKAKYDLLPSSEVAKIKQQFVSLYPGEKTAEQAELISEHTMRELFYQHPVNGVIRVQVIPVAAPFVDDKAEWGGTSQKIKHKGDGFFGAILGKKYGGNVAASAVQVLITDRQGKPVYNWIGGIEVLMQRNGQQFEELPPGSLWQKPKRVTKAAKYAVKPI